jgi:GNAT superfamily N-acetyltransferase
VLRASLGLLAGSRFGRRLSWQRSWEAKWIAKPHALPERPYRRRQCGRGTGPVGELSVRFSPGPDSLKPDMGLGKISAIGVPGSGSTCAVAFGASYHDPTLGRGRQQEASVHIRQRCPFCQVGIPEIQDLNVLPQFRRGRVAASLMDAAEALIAARHDTAGIGVGLYSDYVAAHLMYLRWGYLPDGPGWLSRQHRPTRSVRTCR